MRYVVILVLLAIVLLKQAPLINGDTFQDVDIIFDPDLSPGPPEFWVNGDCVAGAWDYWQDSCNRRQRAYI